jgi:hypothetical protein
MLILATAITDLFPANEGNKKDNLQNEKQIAKQIVNISIIEVDFDLCDIFSLLLNFIITKDLLQTQICNKIKNLILLLGRYKDLDSHESSEPHLFHPKINPFYF